MIVDVVDIVGLCHTKVCLAVTVALGQGEVDIEVKIQLQELV